jgi:hypothetical protein
METSMTEKERFIIGGVGGLAPILMFAVDGSLQKSLDGSYFLIALGFLARVVIMFLIGGFVARLYPEVKLRYKVFQLGVSAPAMIAGLMSASTGSAGPLLTQNVSRGELIPVVYAQTTASNTSDLKHFTLPAPSPLSQFVKGLTNYQAQPTNVWFVIANAYTSLDDARAYAAQINSQFPGFRATVYAPYPNYLYYSVVIGAQQTEAEATSLAAKAVAAGITKAVPKTFPNLPLP